MIIATRITYPTESVQAMAKRFLEAPAQPDFLMRKGPYISSDLKEGIIALSIYELDNAKLGEAYEFLGNYLAIFFGVPGFRYDIKTYFEISEGLKMIGLA